ncbi:OmpA family protein [Mesorhizobium yinganensis]|uniref:OmpA family protein n=1 Tax=Mesorhizobium yinganensis TaxID=3157707 RepID=UPI0032B7D630
MTRVLYSAAFASGSTQLSAQAKSGIEKALVGLANQPTIILDAYADPAGEEGLNMALTTARAEVVREHMISLGYPLHKLLSRARGERQFERPNLEKQAPPSRRVELVALE